mgnify:FL=1
MTIAENGIYVFSNIETGEIYFSSSQRCNLTNHSNNNDISNISEKIDLDA